MQPVVVEPVHPGQGGQLEVVGAAPRTLVTHTLELVEPDEGLGLGVEEESPTVPIDGVAPISARRSP